MWQVGDRIFIAFSSLKGIITKKMECYSTAMTFYPRNSYRVLNKALEIVFETKTPEMNLEKGNERQLIFRVNT